MLKTIDKTRSRCLYNRNRMHFRVEFALEDLKKAFIHDPWLKTVESLALLHLN